MNAVLQQPDTDWPLAQYSTTVPSQGLNWHVQSLGKGPTVVLIHGTGASTHSWRDVALHLSDDFHVVMFDLPGHGFTSSGTGKQMSLRGMSQAITALLDKLALPVRYLVGHSAGAALACQLVLDSSVAVERLVSINGALKPFDGMAGQFFAPLAKALCGTSLIPRLVSWRAAANDQLATKLLDDTGSQLNRDGVAYYGQLLQRPAHVAGALNMMAHWDLKPFWQRLPSLDTPLLLLAGNQDRTVLPRQASEASRRIQAATLRWLPGLGHLAHEESPALICEELRRYFQTPAGTCASGTVSTIDRAPT